MPDLELLPGGEEVTLLHNWTIATHLAILLNANQSEIEDITTTFPRVNVIPLQSSSLNVAGTNLLGKDRKLLIVRPDGYVGFRAPIDDRPERMAYARQDQLTP